MATAKPTTDHPTRAQIIDTSTTTQTRIRNGQACVANAVRPLEESALWLATRRRVHAGGMAMPYVVSTGYTETFRFTAARTPYKSQLRVTVFLATNEDASSGANITVSTTTDATGITQTYQRTSEETVLTANAYEFVVDGGAGDNTDLGTEDVTVVIQGPTGDGSQATVYSISLMWEPMEGSVTVV